jgi:hypothetical protein
MIATMVVPLAFNLWFRKVLNAFEITGGILHVVLFIVFIVVLVVFGPRSEPDFVFKTLISDVSGWNNRGVSWGLGLLSMTFSVSGFDSVLHMSKSALVRTLNALANAHKATRSRRFAHACHAALSLHVLSTPSCSSSSQQFSSFTSAR